MFNFNDKPYIEMEDNSLDSMFAFLKEIAGF